MNAILDFLWEIVQGFIDAGIKFLGNILMGFCSVALKIVNSATNQKNDLYDNICSAFNSVFWFSNNVLIWFGLFILTIGLIWGLSKIILSGQKGTKDDPIALVRRTIVAGILIYASPILIVFCLGHSINKDVEGKNAVISYESGMTVMPNLLTGLSSFDGAGKLKPSKGTITAINNSQDTNADILVKGAQEIGIKNVTADDVGLGAKNTITEDSSSDWTTKEGKELRDYASSQGIEIKKKNKKGKSVNKSDDELKSELATQEYSFSAKGQSVLDALSEGMYIKYGNSGWAKGILWRILYVIIFLIQPAMIVWNLVQMIWVFVKRAVSLILTACLAPVAIAFYPSQSTTEVTSRWVKMLVGYSLTTVLTFAFVKLGSFVYAAAITVQYQEKKLILTIALNFACLAVLGFVKEMEQYANNLGGNLVSFKNGISGQLGKLASSWGQKALFTPLNLAKTGVGFGAKRLPTAIGFMSGNQGRFKRFGQRNADKPIGEQWDNVKEGMSKAKNWALGKVHKSPMDKFAKDNPDAGAGAINNSRMALDNLSAYTTTDGIKIFPEDIHSGFKQNKMSSINKGDARQLAKNKKGEYLLDAQSGAAIDKGTLKRGIMEGNVFHPSSKDAGAFGGRDSVRIKTSDTAPDFKIDSKGDYKDVRLKEDWAGIGNRHIVESKTPMDRIRESNPDIGSYTVQDIDGHPVIADRDNAYYSTKVLSSDEFNADKHKNFTKCINNDGEIMYAQFDKNKPLPLTTMLEDK